MNHTHQKDMKELSALGTLLSGIAMCFMSFGLSHPHEVDSSVLWYFGQCLLYAGGVFAIKSYVLDEINKNLPSRDPKKKTP